MKLLLIDIETAPNLAHVWGLWDQRVGINQIIDSGYTLCWAAKWYGEKGVMFDSVYHSGTTKMLKGIHKLLEEADAVIHYNGTKFDVPTLNKEFILNGLAPPSPYKQIDLLKTARRQFKFPSNKLDYISKALGLGQKTKHVGHELWIGCMNSDPASWKTMEKYNKQDVNLLEKVYDRMLPWIKSHPNVALYDTPEKPGCTNCGSTNLQRRGYSYTSTGIYARHVCKDCGTWSRSRTQEQGHVDRTNVLTRDNG